MLVSNLADESHSRSIMCALEQSPEKVMDLINYIVQGIAHRSADSSQYLELSTLNNLVRDLSFDIHPNNLQKRRLKLTPPNLDGIEEIHE